ncbi:MAG: tetratricopeptide repeat protein [bacterium]
MYIVRWLLTHPLVLAWALAILAILLNFGMGSKHGDEKEAHHHADKEGYDTAQGHHGHTQQPTTPTATATAEPVVTPEAAPVPAVTPESPQATAPTAPEQAPAPVVPATPAIPAAPVVPATPAAPTTPAPAEQPAPEAAPIVPAVEETTAPAPAAPQETAPEVAPIVEEAAPTPEPEAAAPAPETIAEDPHTVVAEEAPAPTAVSSENLLLMARNAYQKGDMANSIQYYQQLIKQTPDNIAYKGELGNVYWRSGQPKEAAALYADIAPQMIVAGQRQEVMNMLGFISLYFPDKVTEIQSLLQQ